MTKNELRIFGVILLVLLTLCEGLIAHNVIYTEGEVIQSLFWFFVVFNIPILLIILWRPKPGLWCAVMLGSLLLPWQTYQNRKCAILHAEVVQIIRFIEETKDEEGIYPKSLRGYNYDNDWISKHVIYTNKQSEYRLDYFMNNAGTGYWFDSKTGFDYYPD